MVLTIQPNLQGRDFVVGDIHGCYYLLDKALREVSFNKETDRLFCLGDLVDRGPYSETVADLLKEPWFFSVLGNHEQFCIDALNDVIDVDILQNLMLSHQSHGGEWFYFLTEERKRELVDLFLQLPVMIELEVEGKKVGLAHGNIKNWDETAAEVDSAPDRHDASVMGVIWGRTRIRQKDAMVSKGADIVFLGHTPVNDITVLGNVHYIDTGAVFGGKLSLLDIKEYIKEMSPSGT